MWNNNLPPSHPFANVPIPPPPPPPQPGDSSITVVYADPEDQARYERRRADLRERQLRRQREEDPQVRQYQEYLFRLNSAHNYFRPDEIDNKPDFDTVVKGLNWLNQRVRIPTSQHQTYLPPPDPDTFHQITLRDGRTIVYEQGPPLPDYVSSSRPMPPKVAESFKVRVKMHENREKYFALLNATEFFFAGDWTLDDMASFCGGVFPASPLCQDSLLAAEFALSSFTATRGRGEISLKRLIRVNMQTLGSAAVIYWLTLEGSNDEFYEAVVVASNNRSQRALKFIRPAKYYPEIPADCHHFIGPD